MCLFVGTTWNKEICWGRIFMRGWTFIMTIRVLLLKQLQTGAHILLGFLSYESMLVFLEPQLFFLSLLVTRKHHKWVGLRRKCWENMKYVQQYWGHNDPCIHLHIYAYTYICIYAYMHQWNKKENGNENYMSENSKEQKIQNIFNIFLYTPLHCNSFRKKIGVPEISWLQEMSERKALYFVCEIFFFCLNTSFHLLCDAFCLLSNGRHWENFPSSHKK